MPTILIAEDEARIRSFLVKGLRANGFSTEVAGDGNDALGRTAKLFIILDLGLPAMDGMEVLRTLRGEGSRLPVVILTGRQGVDETVLGLDTGANDYVTKPFRFDELLARIRVRLRDGYSGRRGVRPAA